jgi:hypothetical protein
VPFADLVTNWRKVFTLPCYTVLYCVILHLLYWTILPYYTTATVLQFNSFCTVLHSAALCRTVQHCFVLLCSFCTTLNVLYYGVLYTVFAEPYCIVLHSTILCTVLYHTLCCNTHYFVLKCNLMFRTEAQCTAHCTFLYYAPLYYNILYCCAH